jgi:hypothetical protein
MPQATRGPLSPEDASEDYAAGLYGRLRCRHGWRRDIFALLFQEYDAFAQLAIEGAFGAYPAWEYLQLVEATNRYLRDCRHKSFSGWFYMKVREGLMIIGTQMRRLDVGEREEEGMRRAFDRMECVIGRWKAPGEARE